VRIAIAGTHAAGKSTLAADLARALPGHRVIEEPYYQLQAEGYLFAEWPTRDDFEAQLERSLRCVRQEHGDVLFDRSPADFLAYVIACSGDGAADVAEWLPLIAEALSTLDLVVFVPIERPDRIETQGENSRLRRRVDGLLREGLAEDGWGFGAAVLRVSGAPAERVRQVIDHCMASGLATP
jgi:predicted ATPase